VAALDKGATVDLDQDRIDHVRIVRRFVTRLLQIQVRSSIDSPVKIAGLIVTAVVLHRLSGCDFGAPSSRGIVAIAA
jgi:hypothetical protein